MLFTVVFARDKRGRSPLSSGLYGPPTWEKGDRPLFPKLVIRHLV